jgi:uncharacterized RDD family membrane protein YckC
MVAADAQAEPIDTTVTIVSPENIAFRFRLAGPASRSLAFLVDSLLIGAAAFAILIAVGMLGVLAEAFVGVALTGLFFLWWGYGAACEVLANGRTAGKAVLGLRVVSPTGLSINPAQAILRNLLRTVDLAPPFFPGLVAMACTSRMQRLGDLAAGTMVVLDRSQKTPRPPQADDSEGNIVPVGFQPDRRLMEAFAAYVGRRSDLVPGRREELAGIATRRLCAAWGVPAPPNSDRLICELYSRTVLSDAENSP